MSRGLFSSLHETGRPFALIDTRERRDHVDGHWFGSTNIPLSVLTTRMTRMVPDRNFPVHLLDWQDLASDAAAQNLSRLGYASVTRCPTSHPGSFGEGFVKGEYVWSKAFGEVLAHTCGLPEVTPSEYLEHHGDALLFDVRPTAEYRQFTIPGSQSLPNSLLLANMDALKSSGQTALLHCAGRTRSIIGACTLKAAGYGGPFAIFKGGTQAWQLDGYDREHQAVKCWVGVHLVSLHRNFILICSSKLSIRLCEGPRKVWVLHCFQESPLDWICHAHQRHRSVGYLPLPRPDAVILEDIPPGLARR